MRNAMVGVALVGLLLAACGGDGASSEERAASTGASSATQPSESSPPSTAEPTASPPPSTSTSTSPPPTTAAASTLPPGPPTFDPQTLGDNRLLPSFIQTVFVANTNNGQLSENTTVNGYVKDSSNAYELASFATESTTDGERRYLIDGRSYEENISGDWFLHEAGSRGGFDPSDGLDLRSGILAGVLTADFADQADFLGVPANHFVFDETDLGSYSSYTPDHPSPEVEGDFYLALEGNYVLYAHSKETSPGRIYEVTEDLSAIGQPVDITLPADLAPMTEALDIGVALARLLPPGTQLEGMLRYEHGIGVDYYSYATTTRSIDDFLSFFRTLSPTDGWTVSHVGHIRPHIEQVNCETEVECVILDNGGDQIVVSFGGGITLEYDREHIFSPL